MRNAKFLLLIHVLFILSLHCCQKAPQIKKLYYEEGKRFERISIKKIWEGELFGRMVLALPQGILLDEIQDNMGREHKLKLLDSNGKLIREKILVSGEGPDEVTVLTLENVWLSSSGKIMCKDNNYLKSLDPETFEIQTLAKAENVINGYGSQYTFGIHGVKNLTERWNPSLSFQGFSSKYAFLQRALIRKNRRSMFSGKTLSSPAASAIILG